MNSWWCRKRLSCETAGPLQVQYRGGRSMRLRWFESTMDAANGLLHVFMALALLIASVLLIWQFAADVIQTLRSGQVAQGFLQALGNLFILWVLSSLISAEVRYMHSGHFSLLVDRNST